MSSEKYGRADGLSFRGIHSANYKNDILTYSEEVFSNIYNKNDNPEGIICLGVAEDILCEDLMLQKLNDERMPKIDAEMFPYFDFPGIEGIQETAAKFLEKYFNLSAPLNAANLIITNGVSGGVDLLAHALADPGEYFLCLTPYYTMTHGDLNARARVNCYNIQLPGEDTEDSKAFIPTKSVLSCGFAKAKNEGKTVRGLFVINPTNPTGDVYTEETIREILSFCYENNLHVIFDEIYALSIWDRNVKFTSVLSMDLPDPSKVHFLYGLSKDFNIPGFRLGILHTHNKAVFQSVYYSVLFQLVPSFIQHLMKALMADYEWLDQVYFPTKQKRTKAAYDFCCERLQSFGAHVRKSKATCFVWANFAKFLDSADPDDEDNLMQEFLQAGVYGLPGKSLFCNQPGWFRFTFTIQRDLVQLGMERVGKVLQRRKSRQQKQKILM